MITTDDLCIFTIGHSDHGIDRFLQLIAQSRIEVLCDVRTTPRSRFAQFNREAIAASLKSRGIDYLFMGDELGGRPSSASLNSRGLPDYERIAATESFHRALQSLFEYASRFRLVLMCSEHEPLECHRCLLLGRRLVEKGMQVSHILRNGEVENHPDAEERLLALHRLDGDTLLTTRAQRLAQAYRSPIKKVPPRLSAMNFRSLGGRR